MELEDLDAKLTGWGEHAPSRRVTGEGLEEVRAAVGQLLQNPDWVERLLEDASRMPDALPGVGVRNALTSAWVDLEGQRRRAPGHQVLNLPEGRLASSVTIPIETVKAAVPLAQEYADAGWGCFKVKLGGDHDEAVVKALRAAFPDAPIRVDANEGWTLKVAQRMLPVMQRLEVEFVEQPLPRDDWDGLRKLKRSHEVPIFLDESVLDVGDLLTAIRRDAGDGVVIKLAKCGGPFEARRIVKVARDHGWKIMVGCMIESSLGIAAASLLAGAVDYLDLDGNALTGNDPFAADHLRPSRISTPEAPGLGARPAKGGAPLEPATVAA